MCKSHNPELDKAMLMLATYYNRYEAAFHSERAEGELVAAIQHVLGTYQRSRANA